MRHFVIALLQAGWCSGYRAQLPTITPGFDFALWLRLRGMEEYGVQMQYAGTGKDMHRAILFLLKPCIIVRVGAAMLA